MCNGSRISALQDEKSSDVAGGEGWTTVSKYLVPLNCYAHLKMAKW